MGVMFCNVFWSSRVDLGSRALFAGRVAYRTVRCESAAREQPSLGGTSCRAPFDLAVRVNPCFEALNTPTASRR